MSAFVGSIAYCSRETPDTYPGFAKHLAALAQLHPDAYVDWVIGSDIAVNRNSAVINAFAKNECEWIWFIDPDMLFAPNVLQRLLRWNVDVVQVLCPMRHPPHNPVLWEENEVKRSAMPHGEPGLKEVHNVGAGGTLYRRQVFESMQPPWFEGRLGEEDTCFALKAKANGFQLYTDTSTPVGHTTPMVVWWEYVGGRWGLCYESMNQQKLHISVAEDSRIIRPTSLL